MAAIEIYGDRNGIYINGKKWHREETFLSRGAQTFRNEPDKGISISNMGDEIYITELDGETRRHIKRNYLSLE